MNMLKSSALALVLSVSLLALSTPAIAKTDTAQPAAVVADPVRLKLAEQVVAELIPTGTYKNIMKDLMDTMAGGLVEQMMGMDASVIAGVAGAESGGDQSEETAGKTMADIAADKDPNFKERMDITMKVMFSEMGDLMSEMEPTVRTAMADIYARKYSAKELADMNAFFATPSGARFAGNFMATFTDKEMIQASFGMMPKVLEAMPAIMKKVEAATAHLPPLPQVETEVIAEAEVSGADIDTSNEPWFEEDNWTPKDRNKAAKLRNAYLKASEKSEAASNALDEAQNNAIDAARERILADGWKADDAEKPMAAEDNAANVVPPPASPD